MTHSPSHRDMAPMPLLQMIVEEHEVGQRVDKALQRLYPKLSLRARKELWHTHVITLNGRKAAPGQTLCEGDVIAVQEQAQKETSHVPNHESIHKAYADITAQIRFLAEKDGWLFFHKPCGLHSTHLASGGYSLEAYLQEHAAHYGTLHLCNRLDCQTSGIVVAASQLKDVERWQSLEDAKKCQKRYVALVHLPEQRDLSPSPIIVRAALDTHKRKITRVLDTQALQLRQTAFMPLGSLTAMEYTALRQHFSVFPEIWNPSVAFMGCTIYKGARHQIRAHAAHAGFPLFHDVRYTQREAVQDEAFILHHGALYFGNEAIYAPPPWHKALGQDMRKRMQDFLGNTFA